MEVIKTLTMIPMVQCMKTSIYKYIISLQIYINIYMIHLHTDSIDYTYIIYIQMYTNIHTYTHTHTVMYLHLHDVEFSRHTVVYDQTERNTANIFQILHTIHTINYFQNSLTGVCHYSAFLCALDSNYEEKDTIYCAMCKVHHS